MPRHVKLRHLSLLFSGSLFSLLLLSWTLLTPQLVQRELGMTRADLLYKSQDLPVIASALEQMRVERNEDIDPSPLPIFRALALKRQQEGGSLKTLASIASVVKKFNADTDAYVALEQISFKDNGYQLTGEIQNADLQGATVLAELMSIFESHNALQVVRYPAFKRAMRDGALVTPFTTTLQHD
jgi:hypothetical protein